MNDHEAINLLLKDLLDYKKREAKYLLVALIAVIIMNIAMVGAFLYFEAHMDTVVTTTTTTEQEVTGDDGNIVNGDQYNDRSQNKSGANE